MRKDGEGGFSWHLSALASRITVVQAFNRLFGTHYPDTPAGLAQLRAQHAEPLGTAYNPAAGPVELVADEGARTSPISAVLRRRPRTMPAGGAGHSVEPVAPEGGEPWLASGPADPGRYPTDQP